MESSSLGGNLTQSRFEDIINHPLMNVNIDEYPIHCQYDYHSIWGHYHYAFDHPDEMYFHRKQAIVILERIAVEKRLWLTHARFLLIGLSTFKMFKEFDEELVHIMDVINAMPKAKLNSSFLEELDHTLYNININRDLDEGNYSKISGYLSRLETIYKNPELNIDTNLRMVFYFNFAYSQLATGNYKAAVRWSNEILNDPDMRNIRQDLQCYTRIFKICIHYALGNNDLIRSLVKSTSRFLKIQNRDTAILMAFLKFANNHFIEPYNESKRELFDNTTADLRSLSKDEEGKITLEYLEFVSWFEAYYKGLSMEDVVKNKSQKKALA